MSNLLDPLQAAINEARRCGDRMLVALIDGEYRLVNALKRRAKPSRQLEIVFDEMSPETRARAAELNPLPKPKPPPKPKPARYVLVVTGSHRSTTLETSDEH